MNFWSVSLLFLWVYAQGSKKIGETFRVDGFLSNDGQNTIVSIQSAGTGWTGLGYGGADMASVKGYIIAFTDAAGKVVVTDNKPVPAGYGMPVYNPKQTSKVIPLAVTKESWAKIAFSVQIPVQGFDFKFTPTSEFIYAFGNDKAAQSDQPSKAIFPKHSGANRGSLSALDFTQALKGNGPTVVTTTDSNQPILSLPNPNDYQTVILIHGYVMVFSWLLCPFIGIFIARYLKHILGIWWFRLHWIIMTIGVGFGSLTGIIFIYLYKSPPHFSSSTSLHPLFGLIISICLIIQIILGVIADKMWSPERTTIPWWDKAHWWLGRICLLIAIVNITLGFLYYNEQYAGYPIVMIILTALVLVGGIGMMVYGQVTIGQKHDMKEEETSLNKQL